LIAPRQFHLILLKSCQRKAKLLKEGIGTNYIWAIFASLLGFCLDLGCARKQAKVATLSPEGALQRPGGRFSKAPETFRARYANAKSRTLRLQRCFIRKL